MCEPVSMAIAAGAAVANAGLGYVQGRKAAKRQKQAGIQAQKDAADTKALNERAINQANQKKPNLAALFGANRAATGGGVGSTMLTGPGGAPGVDSLMGRSTLLGR